VSPACLRMSINRARNIDIRPGNGVLTPG